MARAGRSVLLLEQSEIYVDRVRGEWISPWGVAEVRRLGIYDILRAAGGHHLNRHVSYHEGGDPLHAEENSVDLGRFIQDVPGPLCLSHPRHCQALFDAARAAGADARRGVQVGQATFTPTPAV